jgi:hypothetical protein
VDYRVNGDFSGTDGNFPGSLEDLKCAVRWLRHNASLFRVEPTKVYALGEAAGAHHAAMLAVTGAEAGYDESCGGAETESDFLQGVVDFYGQVDWAGMAQQLIARGGQGIRRSEQNLVGSDCETEPDISTLCAEASVAAHLDATDPPFFISHSVDDSTIPVEQSQNLNALLVAGGHSPTYAEVTAQPHGYFAAFQSAEVRSVRDRILSWLANPAGPTSGSSSSASAASSSASSFATLSSSSSSSAAASSSSAASSSASSTGGLTTLPPLKIGVMVHIETQDAWQNPDQLFESYINRIRNDFLPWLTAHGARFTWEFRGEITELLKERDPTLIDELLAAGQGVGVHADLGYPESQTTLSEFTTDLSSLRTELLELYPETQHVSGICSSLDWVTAARDAGYLFTTGNVAYCVMSMPYEDRPAE